MADPVKAPSTFQYRLGSSWIDLGGHQYDKHDFRHMKRELAVPDAKDANKKGLNFFSNGKRKDVNGTHFADNFIIQDSGKFYGEYGNDKFWVSPRKADSTVEINGDGGDDRYYIGGGDSKGTVNIRDSWGKNTVTFWPGDGYKAKVSTVKVPEESDVTDLVFMGTWNQSSNKGDYDTKYTNKYGDEVLFNSKNVGSVNTYSYDSKNPGAAYQEPPDLTSGPAQPKKQ